MERQSKGSRGLEAYCKGGQGPPQAVAPPKKKHNVIFNTDIQLTSGMEYQGTFYSSLLQEFSEK